MNSKNIVIGILALTTIGAGVFGWTQMQRANELDANVAKLTKAAAERNQRRSGGEQRAQTVAVQNDDQSARSEERGEQGRGGPGNWQQRGGNIRSLMESPEAAKLMASQQRGMLDTRYASLFKSLNLPPEQLAKMKDLLVEKQNAARDVMAVAREQGLDFRNNRAEIQQLIKQSSDDVDASITALIGQDKFAQYQNFDQTQSQRAVVGQIEQRLSYTAEPMTAAQSEQLVSLLAANTSAPAADGGGNRVFVTAFAGAGGGGGFGGMMPSIAITGGVEITNAVIKQAQSFLSTSQVDALRQMQAEQNDQKKLQQLMIGGGNTGGGDNSNTGGGGNNQRGRRGRGGQGN